MATIRHGKLVRDLIPDIIEAAGKTCVTRTLSHAEYLAALDAKLAEELAEYQADKSMEELADLLDTYGEAPAPSYYTPESRITADQQLEMRIRLVFHHQIAAAICRRRAEKPVQTTLELVDIIRSAMPPAALREKQHPAKRSFQAIRIAVNDELGAVEKIMTDAAGLLNPGGRLAIITFHSLEDRLVKTAFNDYSQGCKCPKDFPICVCGNKPKLKVITKKPITASQKELNENSRSKCAKLRIAEKL